MEGFLTIVSSIPDNIPHNTSFYLLIVNLLLIAAASLWVLFCSNLIRLIILMSLFSLLSALCYLLLDAPDVAMTEIALGGALSSCVWLNVVQKIGYEDTGGLSYPRLAIATITIIAFMAVLMPALQQLPEFGSAHSPIHHGASKYYLNNTMNDIGIDSVVAAILASYRGYDTLGETTVILIAAIGVLLIMNMSKKNA